MPHSHHHPLPKPPKVSRLGRGLAAVQVLKETATIFLIGLPLVQAQPLVLLAALPGVVLYALHWRLVLRRTERRFAAVVWVFTLLDELLGLLLFRELEAPTYGQVRLLYGVYFLGLGIILLALGELAWCRWRARARQAAGQPALANGRA